MFGGQQFQAYKTIMKTPRYLPRHTEADVRLFRTIVWGAVIVVCVYLTVLIAVDSAAPKQEAIAGVFAVVIPIVLTLLFFWWLIDVAPILSRWLVAITACTTAIGCVVMASLEPSFSGYAFVSVLIFYLAAVMREAGRQIRSGAGRRDSPEHS